jgi:hypothetical protein
MQNLTKLTRRYEKVYPSILKFEFDQEMDYFKTEAYFQKLQEQLIESFSNIKKFEMSIDLQKGYRILLQMIDNARNLLQYQMNVRTGRAYYLENKINIKEFLSKNIEKEAWEKMDVENVFELSVNERMAFFVLSNVMLRFREFFIDLTEKMLNKPHTKKMAENLVDKVSVVPIFEDETARKHDSLEKFVSSLPSNSNSTVVKIEPPTVEDENESEDDI